MKVHGSNSNFDRVINSNLLLGVLLGMAAATAILLQRPFVAPTGAATGAEHVAAPHGHGGFSHKPRRTLVLPPGKNLQASWQLVGADRSFGWYGLECWRW